MIKNKRICKIFIMCFLILFVVLLTNDYAKPFYDAKKIYEEIKPAVVDKDRAAQRKKNEVLIILYHNVTDKKKLSTEDDLYVHIDDFRDQLDYIVQNGYNVLTVEELYELRQNNEEIPPKSLVLTFDDGDKSSYNVVFPELKKRNLKASFFVTTRQLNDKGFVSKENLIEMHKAGQDIQSQGHYNEDFINEPISKVHKSLYLSKKILEETLGKKILFLVYPNSSFNSEIIRVAQDVGYQWGLSTETGKFYDHYFIMERVSVPGGSDLNQFVEKLNEFGY